MKRGDRRVGKSSPEHGKHVHLQRPGGTTSKAEAFLTSPWCRCSCKGASHYGLTKDRKRRSQDGCPDGCASLTATALSPEVSAAATASLMTDEPGLDNAAYVSTAEDGQPANSALDSGRSNRTRGESSG